MDVKLKIKKGDKVVVLAGRDKGKQGEVLGVFPKEGYALVAGINLLVRHQKQTAKDKGGIIKKEGKIHISNLAIFDPKTKKPSRIGYKMAEDGAKIRIAKKSGATI